MGLLGRALVTVGAVAVLLPSAVAAQTWGAPVVLPGPVDWSQVLAPLPGGGSIWVRGGAAALVRTVDGAGVVADEQALGDAPITHPSVATDTAGEAVLAFDDAATLMIAAGVRAPDGSYAAPVEFPGSFDYAAPPLAVSPDGWAAVAFMVEDADGQRVHVAVRPPGGAFAPGAPAAAPSADPAAQSVGGVAIDDSGEVALGYQQGGVAHAALRTAGELGVWLPPQALGGEPTDAYSQAPPPVVGIDAAGGAVAVWQEGRSTNQVEPVRASFRAPGGSFGEPQELVDSWSQAPPALVVSAVGEAIVLVTPAVQLATGVSLRPFAVLAGSTVLGRFGAPESLSSDWAIWPAQLAMNARGDAVAAWFKCCPAAVETHRRAPFGAFDPAQDIRLPDGTSGYYADQVGPPAVDPFGNMTLTWVDGSTGPYVRSFVTDAPARDAGAVPPVVPPSPLVLTDLVPGPLAPPDTVSPQAPFWWPLSPLPVGAGVGVGVGVGGSPAPAPAPGGAPPTGASPGVLGPLAVAVPRLPSPTGSPRFVVAVRCPWACRASVVATLVTPDHRRLRLPRVALTADAPGVVTAALRLTPAAARALRVAPARGRAGAARRASPRRFRLSLTATAGDRTGAPQAVSIQLAFVRR